MQFYYSNTIEAGTILLLCRMCLRSSSGLSRPHWALLVVVLTITHVGALFPFCEASVLSNRSRKSLAFATARWAEQPSADWLASFGSALADWPECTNGTESRRCRVPPRLSAPHQRLLLLLLLLLAPPPTTPPHPFLAPEEPHRSVLPPVPVVTHCLLRLEM